MHLKAITEVDAVMAEARSENFPVALRLLPKNTRQHLLAIYAYARLVDNLGDEYSGNRSQALDWVEAQLDSLFAGIPQHPVFCHLASTVSDFGLQRSPFDRLLEANRLDQYKTRYADWQDLMDYCKLSANPVGHLVLAVFDAATPERVADSDYVCSGLQVLEHLQDVAEDAAAGRVYLPADDMERFGVSPCDLLAPTAGAELRGLVAYEASRARGLLTKGRKLVTSLRGPSRLAIAGFVAGGLAGLDALESARFEVLSRARRTGTSRLILRFAMEYASGWARQTRAAVPHGANE